MRKLLTGLTAVIAAAIFISSCGSSSSTIVPSPTPTSGQFALMATDAPICSVASFKVTITSATLTPQSGGSAVPVIDASNPVTVDFASLMGFNTLLDLSSVPAGTYSQVTFTFMPNPLLTVFEGNPPVPTTINATLTQTTVKATINPALVVSADTSNGLTLDFRLFQSIQTDPITGQITGTVDPAIRVFPAVITSVDGLGVIDALDGVVQTVTTTSSNTNFTGSFTLQVRLTQTFKVNVTSDTNFSGVSDLTAMTQGLFVEVDAIVDQDGNIVARRVMAESVTDATTAAFVGPVLSVTTDSTGNATQLTMLVRHEHPDVSATVPLLSTLAVSVSPETGFKIAKHGTDTSPLPFDSSVIARGQEVVVHGPFAAGTPPIVTAKMIVLRPQPALGNVLATPSPVIGSDGKTGGYYMAPCNPLFQNQIVNVVTSSDTIFTGLTDLNGLDNTSVYMNRGFLFYTNESGSLNGLPWTTPPPAYVFPAQQVRKVNLP